MTDRHSTVVVTSDDTLPGIVERVREAARGGQIVHLVVPIDSSLLLTASEFRTLKDALDADRLPALLRTADPLRLQLAARLGLRAQAMSRPKPKAATAAIAAVPARPVSTPPSVQSEDWPGELVAAAAPATPRLDPAVHWPGVNGRDEEAGPSEGDEEPLAEVQPDQPGNPPRRWLPVAAFLIVLVLGALLAIRFVAPRAVVTIVPRAEPVAASLLFDVTSDGRPLDDEAAFALTPREREIEVVWTGKATATGVRTEPDGTAEGPIELRNASAEPLTVTAGTVVSTEDGIEFAFTEDVTVPAAAASGEPGAATGTVRATRPGSVGNAGTGQIGGRLPNGVYYSNRMQPAAGGTDKEFPVAAAADLQGLAAAARDAAPALAAEVLAREDEGAAVVPSSVTVTDQVDVFDHQAGDEVETVSLESTLTLKVVTYDGDEASARYEEAMLARLEAETPDGFAVTPDVVRYDGPVEVRESERGVRLEVAARADAVAVLDEAERAALAAKLAGASPDEAAAILADSPEVADFTINYSPPFLPRQMPGNAARIEFETAR